VCRQVKSVDNGSTSQEHRRLPPGDESSSPYQSPSSLSSSSDVDRRSPRTWHTPRSSPRPPSDGHEDPASRGEVDHSGDGDPVPASLNGDVVDEHSTPVWIPRELMSSDITAAATERRTDASPHTYVEYGEYVYRC